MQRGEGRCALRGQPRVRRNGVGMLCGTNSDKCPQPTSIHSMPLSLPVSQWIMLLAHFPLSLSFVLFICRFLYPPCCLSQIPLPRRQLYFWAWQDHHSSFLFAQKSIVFPNVSGFYQDCPRGPLSIFGKGASSPKHVASVCWKSVMIC